MNMGNQLNEGGTSKNELSKLEIDLLRFLATSETMESAAKLMDLSEHALKLLLITARRKLDVKTTFQAIAKVVSEGAVEIH